MINKYEVMNFFKKLEIWIIVLLWRLPLEVGRWLSEMYNIEQLRYKRKRR